MGRSSEATAHLCATPDASLDDFVSKTMAVKRTKVVVKVELPAGKLGLTAVGSPPTVGAVGTDLEVGSN